MPKMPLRALVALALGLPALANAAVFVNEVHYDNASTDTGEAIEVVATAGEDLTTYSIVLYNGSNSLVYDTDLLPTGVDRTCGTTVRVATLSYPVDGIQNGSPDGIALVDTAVDPDAVVQFLSYEGTITAANGPAMGMTSTDILVAESGSTPAGQSLQLAGMNGTSYASFMWQAPAAATFGQCNTGQTFMALVDDAPEVETTDPADMDTNVSPFSQIVVTFNEPVDADEGWFSLACDSGPQNATFGGGPTVWTISPDNPLPILESCTLNLDPAFIVDLDGSPNNLVGATRFTFSIADDVAPTIDATTPAANAGDVALDATITIKFSEPVDVGVGGPWFTIGCSQSGSHSATHDAGPLSTYVLTPDAPFVGGENCLVTIAANRVVDVDGDPDNLAMDFQFDFDTMSDDAPDVQSFVPANGATGVSQAANVVVTFTESVTLAPGAFAINCVTTGAHTFAQSPASPATQFTLNPDVDFGAGENCTVTVSETAVTDVDGTPDVMADPRSATFTTGAGDPAPTVVRAQPVDNSTAAPSAGDITFVFSEDVTAPAGAFAISCSVSGPHAFTLSQDETRAVLNPTTDFVLSETCTVTVTGAQVLDVDGTPTPMSGNYVLDFTTQNDGTGYYASVDASSCTAIRASMHNTIDDHTAHFYSAPNEPSAPFTLPNITPTWSILEFADEDPGNTGRILDIYRNRVYTKVDCRSGAVSSCPSGASARYNREHTWPNSLGFPNQTDGDGNANAPYTDTHMLYLSAEDYNASRGNKAYRTCGTTTCPTPTNDEQETDVNAGQGGGTGTYPGNSNWDQPGGYEVWNVRKGDAARAILYMAIRYDGGTHGATGQAEPDLRVTNVAANVTSGQPNMGLLTDLLAWHAADPPDARERMRNEIIYSYQGNRNPFIDHPEWAAIAYPAADPENGCTSAQVDVLFQNGFEN